MLTTRKYLRSEIRPANDTSSSPHTHTPTHPTHTHTHTHTLQVNGNIPTWSQFTSSLPPDVFKVYIYFRVGGRGRESNLLLRKKTRDDEAFQELTLWTFQKKHFKTFFLSSVRVHSCAAVYNQSILKKKEKKRTWGGIRVWPERVFLLFSLREAELFSLNEEGGVCVCVCVCVWVSVSVCVHVCVLSFKEKGG